MANYDLFAGGTQEIVSERSSHTMPTPASEVSDEPSSATGALPDIGALYIMYRRLNREYFDNLLPPVTIEYSSHMVSTAGSWSASKRLIRIGRRYHEVFPVDLLDTLKHEMIHIIHPAHNAAFRREAKRLGVSIKARYHPSLARPPRYLYVCPQCGREYPRQKRLKMASCGACSRANRFDSRCKLKLRRP